MWILPKVEPISAFLQEVKGHLCATICHCPLQQVLDLRGPTRSHTAATRHMRPFTFKLKFHSRLGAALQDGTDYRPFPASQKVLLDCAALYTGLF